MSKYSDLEGEVTKLREAVEYLSTENAFWIARVAELEIKLKNATSKPINSSKEILDEILYW